MLDDFVATVIEPGVGVAFPDYVLIVALVVLFIFFALDIRIGLLITFVSIAGLYVAFAAINWPTNNILTVFMGIFVLLVLSLFIPFQKSKGGYA